LKDARMEVKGGRLKSKLRVTRSKVEIGKLGVEA
jgi:hypothetical protein